MNRLEARAGLMMAMASMMFGESAPYAHKAVDPPQSRRRELKRLPNYRVSDLDIPKGCKKVTERFLFEVSGYTLYIEADVVFGSQKAYHKRVAKINGEISGYLRATPIYAVIEFEQFTVVARPETKPTAIDLALSDI